MLCSSNVREEPAALPPGAAGGGAQLRDERALVPNGRRQLVSFDSNMREPSTPRCTWCEKYVLTSAMMGIMGKASRPRSQYLGNSPTHRKINEETTED